MADVFLSYKREDSGRAKEIADAIEAHGFSVFFDAEIEVGEAWNRRIETELNASRCVVVLWSARSSDSGVGEWVHNEARIGKQRGILAPALIGDAPIPLEFSGVQAADLRAWRGDPADPHWVSFIERIGKVLNQKPKALAAQPWRRRSVRWVAAIAVLAAAGIGVAVWLGPQFAPKPAPQPAPNPSPILNVPDQASADAYQAEWAGYLQTSNCKQMAVWLADIEQGYPDWQVAKGYHAQFKRICPEAAATPPPPAASVATTAPPPPADFLAGLRARDATPLNDAQITAAAARLGVEPAAIRAVIEFESGKASGFDAQGRPAINFESHIFSRLTNHKYDSLPSGVSTRQFTRGSYARTADKRWELLQEAYKLDPAAALKATSWGKFRISGLNFSSAGFKTPEDFVRAQAQSEEQQLESFEAFLKSVKADGPLAAKDWVGFTRIYFGAPTYAKDLDALYRKYSAAPPG